MDRDFIFFILSKVYILLVMTNEKQTENLTRRFLESNDYTKGFIEKLDFIVDEQSSQNPRIIASLK